VTINALGEVERRVYDGIGQVVSTIRYGNRLDTSTLSAMNGGLVSATLQSKLAAIASQSIDGVTSSAYGRRGELVSSTDELGNTTTASYNAFGNLAERVSPGASGTVKTAFTYDRRGLRLTEIDDAAVSARKTSTAYDTFGRVID